MPVCLLCKGEGSEGLWDIFEGQCFILGRMNDLENRQWFVNHSFWKFSGLRRQTKSVPVWWPVSLCPMIGKLSS